MAFIYVSRKGVGEEDGIPDAEEEIEEPEEVIHETMFTFEAFETVGPFVRLPLVF
jgi:hypothetical protein